MWGRVLILCVSGVMSASVCGSIRITHSELCGLVFHQSSRPLEEALRTGAIALSASQIHFLIRLFKEDREVHPEGSEWARKITALVGASVYRLAFYTAERVEKRANVSFRVRRSTDRLTLRTEAVHEVFTDLPRMIENFDFSRGARFSTYFESQIRLNLIAAYTRVDTGNQHRLDHNTVRVARRVRELRAESRERQQLLSDEELCLLLKVEFPKLTMKSLQNMLTSHHFYESSNWKRLDAPVRTASAGMTRLDLLMGSASVEEEAEILHFRHQVLMPFRTHLEEVASSTAQGTRRQATLYQKFIVIWDRRFFAEEELTQQEVADLLNVPRQSVQGLEARLMDLFRDYANKRKRSNSPNG